MQRLISLLLLVFLTSAAFGQSVSLNWSEDGNRFWFRRQTSRGHAYVLFDVRSHLRTQLFSNKKLATALSKQLGHDVKPDSVDVKRVAFGKSSDELHIRARGWNWLLNLDTYELTKAEFPDLSEERSLFMPPRRSGGSNEETAIRITNSLDQPLNLFWIDRAGDHVKYGEIRPGETREQHTFVGHVWMVEAKLRSGCFVAQANGQIVIDDVALKLVRREAKRRNRRIEFLFRSRSPRSPAATQMLSVRDHDLWLTNGGETRITFDGSADNTYSYGRSDTANVRWSPDSTHVVMIRTNRPETRKVHFIESSPKDQLQPRIQTMSYAKPGDELETPAFELFSVEDGKRIEIADTLMQNPWSIRFEGWAKSSDRFYLRFNQRGHQVLRLLEVSTDGSVRTIVEEKSDTFIHYSNPGKSVFEFLSADEILWASERSGWNHLYRYSLSKRELLNPVTSGDWNMKRIERIDRESKTIWFYAVGVYEDQDPYHEHFCRVNFDGTNFKVLTEGDGTHRIAFEQGTRYFLDTYSRVDMAPVTELRDSDTGKIVAAIRRESTESARGPLPERFVAKGRDGETDVWGIIHFPRNFDENKTYPVVEKIYAGPHDHHVPKSYRPAYRVSRIADAGMIVVQIDGMGTAWRSKKFHDVCYKNLRDAGFPDRIAWMKAAAKKFPQMDLSRVGIYGGSAGGQNAMAALLWHNDFYKVAVADCGCHDNRMDKIWWNEQWMGWPVDDSYKQNSNMENAHLLKGDLMLIVGELDRNVDPASTTQVVSKLIKANKDFEFVLVAGAGHGSAETPWASRKRLNFLKEKLGVE